MPGSPARSGARCDARRARSSPASERTLDKSVLNYPDFVVFDLDPYLYSGKEGRGEEPELHRRAFTRTRALALRAARDARPPRARDLRQDLGPHRPPSLPPDRAQLDFDAVRAVAETIARHARAERPREVTLEWAVERRRGKIFFDYNQNVRGKSLAVPFSPRRHPGGTVVHAGRLGGAGVDLSHRLHPAHRAGAAGDGG